MIIILFAAYQTFAQNNFEFDVTTRVGQYFPVNTKNIPADLFPDNAISPAAGFSLGYNVKNTSFFLGLEYAYLSPDKKDLFTGENINVKWQYLGIPLYVQQGIWKNFYLTAGATLVRQIKGYYKGVSSFPQQEIPEYNWQAGAGYKLNDLKFRYSTAGDLAK